MENFRHDARSHADLNQARDRAIVAFLSLGERLKALAERGGEKTGGKSDEEALGAKALYCAIEGEIIPRMMLAHRSEAPRDGAATSGNLLTQQDHDLFLQFLLQSNSSAARLFAEDLLRRGVSRDDLFLNLLAKTARRLGEMWDCDLCDFSEVTIGLCRLHEIVRHNAADIEYRPFEATNAGPKILLTTACADQHVFGVMIVADCFRSEGWRVTSEPGAEKAQVIRILSERHYDVLGISAARTAGADVIAEEIRAFRAASRNKNLKIMVGGWLFAATPSLVHEVGADAFAGDAKLAVQVATNLIGAKAAAE